MVRGLGAAEEPSVGSTEETEGKTLRRIWCGCEGRMLTRRAGAGTPKPHPLPGMGSCQGQGCYWALPMVVEGRFELHHLLFIPVETTYKPLLTLAGLRLTY